MDSGAETTSAFHSTSARRPNGQSDITPTSPGMVSVTVPVTMNPQIYAPKVEQADDLLSRLRNQSSGVGRELCESQEITRAVEGGKGWQHNNKLYWSEHVACASVATKVTTIFGIFPFSCCSSWAPPCFYPRRDCRRILNFCMGS